MGLRPTTTDQVEGHAFVVHRARTAVSGQDISTRSDGLRTQMRAVYVGVGIGAVLLAGAAVLAFVRPAPNMDTIALAQVRQTGGLFVQVDGVFHAVPNLVSARLVAGSPLSPQLVPAESLEQRPQGPMVGIPGAPALLPDDVPSADITWTVCDAALPGQEEAGTAVVATPGRDAPRGAWDAAEGVLVNRDGQGWLLAAGQRMRVDLEDAAVMDVLGLHSWPQQHVSDTLLELLPEAPPLGRLTIPGQGAAAPLGPDGMVVGEVFAVETTAGRTHFVVLLDGIQEIPQLTAELLRATGESRDKVELPVLAPAQVTAPRVNSLDAAALPAQRPRPAARPGPVLCAVWQGAGAQDGPAMTGLLSAARLSDFVPGSGADPGTGMVMLAGADGSGPHIDAVVFPPGGLPVRPVGTTSTRAVGSERALLAGTGTRHTLVGEGVPAMLGLPEVEVPIPATLLRAMPAGPQLSQDAARVLYDAPQVQPAPRVLTEETGGN